MLLVGRGHSHSSRMPARTQQSSQVSDFTDLGADTLLLTCLLYLGKISALFSAEAEKERCCVQGNLLWPPLWSELCVEVS